MSAANMALLSIILTVAHMNPQLTLPTPTFSHGPSRLASFRPSSRAAASSWRPSEACAGVPKRSRKRATRSQGVIDGVMGSVC